MLRVSELPEFGFFQERGFFQSVAQPQLDDAVLVDNAPLRSDGLARPSLRPAPLMGEHTRQVIADILGLDDREIDVLLEKKVLESA